MAAAKTEKTLQIPVALSEQAFQFLDKNANGDPAGKLAQWVQYYVSQIASGGIVLEAVDHQHLAELRQGKRFRSSREVTKFVETALGRDEGQYVYKVAVDPAMIQPLAEFATQQGITLDALVQDSVAQLLAMGWLYDCTPDRGTMIPVEHEMVEAVRKATGKSDINSADYVTLIREALAARAAKKD